MHTHTHTLARAPGMSQELVSAVGEELRSEGDKRGRQLQLLSAITSDVSDPTIQLISKLNCEPKRKPPVSPSEAQLCTCRPYPVSGEEMFELAAAVFGVRSKCRSFSRGFSLVPSRSPQWRELLRWRSLCLSMLGRNWLNTTHSTPLLSC